LLLLVAVILIVLSFRTGPVPRVILWPANTSLAPKRVALDQWVPMSWAWYWRAKDFVLGHSRTVVIDANFVGVPAEIDQLSAFPPPVKTVTNLHIYLIRTNECASMYKHLTRGSSHSAACRIATAHGIQTRLFNGQSTSRSFSLELLAKRQRDGTDLRVSIEAAGFDFPVTSAVTNLAMAARFQIPKDHAVFIIKSAEPSENTSTVGVILTPKWK